MYFGRYIWNYIERVYLRRVKRNDFFQYTNKFPSIIIPRMFLNNYEKMIKRRRFFSLRKNNKIINYKFLDWHACSLLITINKNYKYKIYKFFIYLNNYNYLLKFTKFNVVYYYDMYDLFLSMHIGRYYIRKAINNYPLTLSVLTETITYGSREAKKKKKEQNKKKSVKKK